MYTITALYHHHVAELQREVDKAVAKGEHEGFIMLSGGCGYHWFTVGYSAHTNAVWGKAKFKVKHAFDGYVVRPSEGVSETPDMHRNAHERALIAGALSKKGGKR